MRTFFTSDLHLFHNNILKYCNRPFSTIEEMHEEFKKRWNSTVTEKDKVYILGDLSLHNDHKETLKFFKSLNGCELHLILGNHDKGLPAWFKSFFTSCSDYKEITFPDPTNTFNGEKLVVLSHYPFRNWNMSHRGSYNFYGHTHGFYQGNTQQTDVGVDCWNYTPCSYEQLQEKMKTLPAFYQEKTD